MRAFELHEADFKQVRSAVPGIGACYRSSSKRTVDNDEELRVELFDHDQALNDRTNNR